MSATEAPRLTPDLTPITAAHKWRSKTALTEGFQLAKTQVFRDTSLTSSTTTTTSRTTASPAAAAAADIRAIAWSPLGSLIASADSRLLRVWNSGRPELRMSTELKPPINEPSSATAKGRPVGSRLHLTGTEKIVWNPWREAELCSVGNDGIVRLWDVRTRGQMIGGVKIDGEGHALAWRPQWAGGDDILVGTKENKIFSISRSSLSVISSEEQKIPTNGISFMNSGHEVLIARGNGNVDVALYPSMKIVHTLTPHASSATLAIPAPRGEHILTGGGDAMVALFTIEDWSCPRTFPKMCTGIVRSLSYSFDGSYIIAGDDDADVTEGIRVVHAQTGDEVFCLKTNGENTPCVAWHPNRHLIAYTGGDEANGALKITGANVF